MRTIFCTSVRIFTLINYLFFCAPARARLAKFVLLYVGNEFLKTYISLWFTHYRTTSRNSTRMTAHWKDGLWEVGWVRLTEKGKNKNKSRGYYLTNHVFVFIMTSEFVYCKLACGNSDGAKCLTGVLTDHLFPDLRSNQDHLLAQNLI